MANNNLCLNCGHEGKAKKETPGSFLTELFLWLMMILPGLIYSIWRIGNKFPVCEKCKSKNIIPSDSPVAIRYKQSLVNK